MKKVLLLSSLIFVYSFSYSVCTSVSGGWNSASSWSCGHVPGCADAIVIAAGTTVTISSQLDYSGCGVPMSLTINGQLLFTTGNKLKLPTGSVIVISSTGSIVPGNGAGSANLIEIAGVDVWSSDYGTATGPVTVTQFTPLPIELISFTAKMENNKVRLNWVTASETNNDYFTLQKTYDGSTFEDFAVVDGGENSSSMISYSHFDVSPYEGKSYYRLKQTDFDGNFSLSNLVVLDNNNEMEFSFDIYPNPSDGEGVNIEIMEESRSEILLVIYNVNGRKEFSKIVFADKGKNNYVIENSEKLLPGIYFVSGTSGEKSYNKKLLVK
jgi:hypothetical protein